MYSRPFPLLFCLSVLTFVTTAARVSGQALQTWDFNDAAATPLPGVVNSVAGGGIFATDIPGVATDGAGALAIKYVNTAASAVSYAPIGSTVDNIGLASGTYTLSVQVAAWNLPLGTTSLQTVYFDLRGAASLTASLVAELTFLASDAGVSVRFRDSAAANNNTFLTGLAAVRTTPFLLVLTVNKTANTFSISYTDAGVTTVVITDKAFSAGSAARAITHFDLRTLGDFTNSDFKVDHVRFSAVPALTALQTWRQTYFATTESAGLAADAADPDNDNIANLIEYATGSDPTLPTPSPIILGKNGAGFLTLGFTSIADPTLTYEVLGSNDLLAWSPVFTGTGATLGTGAQNIVDTILVSSQPRRFLKLSITR